MTDTSSNRSPFVLVRVISDEIPFYLRLSLLMEREVIFLLEDIFLRRRLSDPLSDGDEV